MSDEPAGEPYLAPYIRGWQAMEREIMSDDDNVIPTSPLVPVRLTAPAGVLRAEYSDGTAWWWDRSTWDWIKDTSRGWDALG